MEIENTHTKHTHTLAELTVYLFIMQINPFNPVIYVCNFQLMMIQFSPPFCCCRFINSLLDFGGYFLLYANALFFPNRFGFCSRFSFVRSFTFCVFANNFPHCR